MADMDFTGFVPEDRPRPCPSCGRSARMQPDFPRAVDAYVATLAGEEVTFSIVKKRAKRSGKQHRGFHAMITPWAHDAGHSIDDLKFDLMGEIFGWSEKPSPLTGRVVPLRQHTSDLDMPDYNILIERTMEIAAGCGYVLEAPGEYRERKAKEAKAAQKRKAAA